MSGREKIEAEARRLTPDARRALLTGEDKSLYGFAGAALILRGLAEYRRKWWLFGESKLYPTRFGAKVRKHLEETDQ